MHSFNKKSSQLGISLVEVLIASALGVIIILGVTRSMTTMTQSSRVQLSNNSLQQTADLALSYIESRLRNAMATPCNQINALTDLHVSPLVEPGKISVTAQTTINHLFTGLGIDVTQETVPINGVSVKDSSGTDVTDIKTDNISLIGAADRFHLSGQSGMPESGTSATTTLEIAKKMPASSHDNKKLYVITNCEFMDVFRAKRTNSGSSTLLTTAPNTTFLINYRGDEGSLVSRLSASTIGIDSNGNLYDKPIFKTTAGNTLLDDIALIRVLFGVDNNGNTGMVNQYITAAQLDALPPDAQVLSAEIFVLVKLSDTRKTTDIPNGYTLSIPDTSKNLPSSGVIPTQTITIEDNVMRKVFSRSVTFRNKVTF